MRVRIVILVLALAVLGLFIYFQGSAGALVGTLIFAFIGVSGVQVVSMWNRFIRRVRGPAEPAGTAAQHAAPAATSRPTRDPTEADRQVRDYLTPFELPPAPMFVGRKRQFERALSAIERRSAGGPVVVAVYGDNGVGKTAFAITLAHQVANRFNDGALFAVLGPPATGTASVAAVLGSFVDSLEGPDTVPPSDFAERRQRFVELTSDQAKGNVLIVLDDVHTAEQVTQLLPSGSQGCVLITARQHLDIEVDERIDLEPLDLDESDELLRRLIGVQRVADEQHAADAIVERAAGYPLALQLAASSLSGRRDWSLQLAVVRMHQLAAAGSTEPGSQALDFTYAMLTPDERDVVRVIGLLDTPTFAAWMIAAMLTATPDRSIDPTQQQARRVCDRLVDLRLLEHLTDDATGVAAFRALEHVRSYARARVEAEWDADTREAALLALRDAQNDRMHHDLRSQLRKHVYRNLERGNISRALNYARGSIEHAREDLARAIVAQTEAGPGAVVGWLTAAQENRNLALAALAELLAELGGVDDAFDVAARALAQRTPLASPRALRVQGKVYRRQRRFDEAFTKLAEAKDSAHDAADTDEQLRVIREVALAHATAGQPTAAMTAIGEAFRLAETADREERLRACLLSARAVVLRCAFRAGGAPSLLDDADAALREANRLAEAKEQRLWRAWAGYQRARVVRSRGQFDLCRVLALRAVEDFAEMSHRYGAARCRLEIGRSYLDQQRPADALPALEEAREMFSTLGDRWIEAETAADLARAQELVQGPASAERELVVASVQYAVVGDDTRRAEIDEHLLQLRAGGASSDLDEVTA
jgi:tetratricopeptide (TPR) repeat protein